MKTNYNYKKQVVLLLFMFLTFFCHAQNTVLNGYDLDTAVDTYVPDSWKFVKSCEIEDFSYYLYVDTLTNKRYATAAYIGSATKVKFKNKIKYEKNTYIVKGIHHSNRDTLVEQVNLPESVTFIEPFAFMGRSNLKAIFMPNVEYIGFNAFSSCNSLMYIVTPKLNEIDVQAFAMCENLRGVELEEITTIKRGAFRYCSKLGYIFLRKPENLKFIGSCAFYDCVNMQFVCSPKKSFAGEKIVELPEVKQLNSSAFENCKYIKKVEIGANVEKMEYGVFEGCENLQSVKISSKLSSIPERFFRDCKSLTNIVLASRPDSIKDFAFSGCKLLKGINKEKLFPKYIGESAFMGCSSLTDIGLLSVEDTIRDFSFRGCTSLGNVFIERVKYIGKSAFSGCESMPWVSGADSVKYVGASAFFGCKALRSINGLCEKFPVEFEESYKGAGIGDCFSQSKYDYVPIMRNYKIYANRELKNRILAWQEKKEYESTAQWHERVTEDKRDKKIAEYKDSVKNKYIRTYAPRNITGKIESYDADAEIFKIRVENVNSYRPIDYTYDKILGEQLYLYAIVPRADAAMFKEQWKDVKMTPTYCIANNYLGIATCEFVLNNKKYNAPRLYDDETANVELNLSPLDFWKNDNTLTAEEKYDDTLDKNIPTTSVRNDKTFVVIIGNELYKEVSKVSYAQNDAKVFAEYCQKTLGVPENNIRSHQNATYGMMLSAIKDMKSLSEAYNGDVDFIFYYCGHGVPDEKTKDAFLLPIDANPSDIETCYPISRLYSELGQLPARKITVFMDACFSGAQRGDGMLVAARGVAIKANNAAPQGNMVVFTAASGDETAYPYKEKGHGMFTYFLLKKLNETKGDVSLGELGDYITTQVKQQSVVVNHKSQTPTVLSSFSFGEQWRTMKLK